MAPVGGDEPPVRVRSITRRSEQTVATRTGKNPACREGFSRGVLRPGSFEPRQAEIDFIRNTPRKKSNRADEVKKKV